MRSEIAGRLTSLWTSSSSISRPVKEKSPSTVL